MSFTIKRYCETNLRLTEFGCEIPSSKTIQELTFSRPRVNVVQVPSVTNIGELEDVFEVVYDVSTSGNTEGGYSGVYGVTVRGISNDLTLVIKAAETTIKNMGIS